MRSASLVCFPWLVGSLIPQVAFADDQTAQITNGRFSVTVNDYGVLVGVPDQGLDLGEGRGATLLPGFAEWAGILYEGVNGPGEAVCLGTHPDWRGRTPVERIAFSVARDCATAITRTADLEVSTTFCFDATAPVVLAFSEIANLTDFPLRNILFSREWRPGGPAGWSYPEDLPAPGPFPVELCRVLRMPDDLLPRASQTITHTYELHEDAQGSADDVPLVLWTNADWPGGLVIGETNGVSWGDFNADGWPDFFACESAQLWRNVQGETWKLRRDLDSILPPAGFRYGSSFGDYNNDGLADIGTEPRNAGQDEFMHLLKNLGDADFIDVAVDPNIVDVQPFGDSETLCWIDVDADGNLDAFLPVYPPWAFRGPGNFFLYNLGPTGPGGEYRFTEISAAAGLDNPPPDSARPEGAEFCDVDFDGDPDHYSCTTLFQNVSKPGQPLFRWMTEAASGIQFHVSYDEGAAFFDYDLDGDLDLCIAYCVGGQGVRMYEAYGDGMYFLASKGIIDDPNSGLCLGFSRCDWDMDGDIDFTTKEVFRRNMWVETGDRHFIVASHSIPGSHLTSATPAWADWDKDGDPDCLLGNWLDVGHFYENYLYGADTAPGLKRHLRVKVLRDSTEVAEGLETEYGAIVELRIHGEEGVTKRKLLVSSAGGYLNQNEYAVHFALPPDPVPDDPAEDVRFDVVVDFPSDPAAGILRVDRIVNPELGDIDLADLEGREIQVFRSGKVVTDGCEFAPVPTSEAVMTTTTGGLALPTDTTPLSEPGSAPAPDWYVGMDFETDAASGPQLIKEVIVDGVLTASSAQCGSDLFKVALWDVTDSGQPFIVEESRLRAQRRPRNRRVYLPGEIRVEPGRHYRLVARVEMFRETLISAPVVNGPLTIHGGLSFQDLDPCGGTAVVGAPVDPSKVYVAARFAPHPGPLWTDLGHATKGTNGEPSLGGSGDLTAGSTVTLKLEQALPFAHTFLIGGMSALCLPVRGGTLLPSPDFFICLDCDVNGSFTLAGTWPAGVPAGFTSYFQVWYPDPAAVQGIAASNAVSATTDF